jgi:DNA-binding NarL/FixJ family response regulator
MTLLPQIRHVCPGCKIVILTMYDHVRYASQTLKNGASGFVVKGSPFEELLQAVREVHRNRTFICAAMKDRVAVQKPRGRRQDELSELSSREFEVLILLGNGLAMKEIAAQLHVSGKSVDTYRARIQKKLQLKSKTDLIRYTLEKGLVR